MVSVKCGLRVAMGFALGCVAGSANAFFDGFDGDRLNGWYWFSEAGDIPIFEVKDGSFNFLGLKHHYGGSGGQGFFGAELPNYQDFVMQVRVSWEYGSGQTFDLRVSESFSYPGIFTIGRMWYTATQDGRSHYVKAQNIYGDSARVDVESEGFHLFEIKRTARVLSFALDGSEFFVSDYLSYDDAKIVWLGYSQSGDQFSPIKVDYVSVIVPEPGTVIGSTLLVSLLLRRGMTQAGGRLDA